MLSLCVTGRKLNEVFVQFDNVTTACQFHTAILDSHNCLNNVLSSALVKKIPWYRASVNTI